MEWFAFLMPTICTVIDVNHLWSNSNFCFDAKTNLVGLHYSLKKCHLAGQLILRNFGNSRRGIAPLCWFGTVVLNMQNICQNIFFCQIKSFWKVSPSNCTIESQNLQFVLVIKWQIWGQPVRQLNRFSWHCYMSLRKKTKPAQELVCFFN